MDAILQAMDLKKSFKLSAKQQKLENSRRKFVDAVGGLSFSVNRGEIYGLLGPNGAGKTTTLRMLATLIRPDAGDALLEGRSIVKEPEEVRRRIGFLTSELKLEDYFSPSYLFDFFAQLHGLSPQARAARKAELFDTFGIGEFAGVKVANLSTGMKQKAALAISLAHDPDIVIFDEPTNGLDVLTAKVVTDYLLALRRQGKTLIVSTHIFSLIEKICDRVGVIIGGKMAADGTLQEVCAGQSLEDRFFAIYAQTVGEEA